ncbi:MAG: PQQ-binding-like beta-propeller repeat protein [candidate division KSB1 bacterium]|nr:PQQ-binding-like beta-propeller repeat protein [candidate division KSB1 bacterium]
MKKSMGLIILLWAIGWAVENWPDWRGPTCDGVVNADLPLTWSETQNVKWKTAIPYHGWSTPVIWGNQIWLTTATEDGKQFFAVCVDFNSGKVLQQIKVFTCDKPQGKHPLNSYATPSPVIEEGRVYVHFGTFGTACIDTKSGKILWKWNEVTCDHIQGPASSPLLFENLLILHLEGSDVQVIAAVDKLTGKTVWKTERPKEYYTGNPLYYKAYITPIVITVNGKPQLISNGSKVCQAFDPYTGKEIWRVVYGGDSTISRPIFGDGLVFINCGWEEVSADLWAVDPRGVGDLTAKVVWKAEEHVPIESSPVLLNHMIFMVDDKGTASCLEAKTGSVLWRQRLGGQFGASPIAAAGRVYFFDKKGKTTVVSAERTLKRLAVNQLGDGFWASPAVKERSLILRSRNFLYRVEE